MPPTNKITKNPQNASVNYEHLLTIQLRISMIIIFLMHIC